MKTTEQILKEYALTNDILPQEEDSNYYYRINENDKVILVINYNYRYEQKCHENLLVNVKQTISVSAGDYYEIYSLNPPPPKEVGDSFYKFINT